MRTKCLISVQRYCVLMAGVMQRRRSGRADEDGADEQTETEAGLTREVEAECSDCSRQCTSYDVSNRSLDGRAHEVRDSGDWADHNAAGR